MNLKQQLLNVLTTTPITALELSKKVNYNSETVKSELRYLVNIDKVEVISKFVDTNGGKQLTNFYKLK